ncbi:MAG: hypothetical protein JSS66_05620 [Armatimonadetes bacterium]|nr:hypothetical protein [Armatimonadota bacterium]
MQVTYDKAKKMLNIAIPLDEAGRPSTSGKTKVHASTNGNVKTDVTIGGQPLTIGLNAYTPKA